jgi:hypothetical protein
MGRWVVAAVTAFFLVSTLAAAGSRAQEDAEVYPLSRIRPGLRGVGRTVVQGTRVEEFQFEVLGVTEGPPGRLVLFRASGPAIRRSGGTASGMSGSPMYIDGRFAGALSYGYRSAGPDSDLGLFTPAEAMLELLRDGRAEVPARGVVRLREPVRIGGRWVRAVRLADRGDPGTGPSALPTFVPAASPLLVSGVSDRGFRLLQQTLRYPDVVPVQSYGGVGRFPTPPLVPGSAVGVVLVRGDVNAWSIGTLSYRKGDRFLAFGHRLFGFGAVDFLLTSAYVHTVVRSTEFPFKEGDIGEPVGTVTQDRVAGVAGTLGRLPRVFNVTVTVVDRDRGRTVRRGAQMVRRADLALTLVPQVVLAAVEQAWDGSGAGTAEVRIAARGGGLPRPVERANVFYSAQDVATASVLDVPDAVRFLFANEFGPVNPVDLQVEVRLSRERRTVSVVEAEVASRTVSQGGRLRVRLQLRPFQGGETVSRVVEVEVPRNFPRGPALLVVGSAGIQRDDVPPAALLAGKLGGEPPASTFRDLREALEFFEDFGRNTDVLLQLVPVGVPPSDDPQKRFIYFDEFAGRLVRTPWVVKGEQVVPIVVE